MCCFPNRTWVKARTDDGGEARVQLYATHLPMTVFAARDGLEATVLYNWRPAERALALDLPALPGGGSAIFSEAVGELPGIEGTLNPIRDTLDRTYLYASNIAINEGQLQAGPIPTRRSATAYRRAGQGASREHLRHCWSGGAGGVQGGWERGRENIVNCCKNCHFLAKNHVGPGGAVSRLTWNDKERSNCHIADHYSSECARGCLEHRNRSKS